MESDSMNLPGLTIVFTTYIPPGGDHRAAVEVKTLNSWKEYLKYDGGIHIHIADDGSSKYDEEFWRKSIPWAEVSYSRADRQGVGASLNRAHAVAWEHSPLTFYAQSDWSLQGPMDLTPWAGALMEYDDVGCIRLGIAMPQLRNGKMKHLVGYGWAIDFERYSYYWSQRPAIYHRRFFEAYGSLPENIDALSVDKVYNERIAKNPNGPSVVLALLSHWYHIASIELGTITPVPGEHPPIIMREQKF